jgi:thioredoxin reductase (NADPH)
MTSLVDYALYLVPVLLVLGAALLHRSSAKRRSAAHAEVLREAEAAGLTEPPSLHPVVDLSLCMGAAACVRACPEQAMGIINGKGVLINPSVCIGHGACAPACPTGAIKLVFGTAKRGVEIPQVSPEFETNVPGLFIAGELGGMGLIRNAVKQGTQAIKTIASRPRGRGEANGLDVLIVGAGPAGIAASLAAQEAKLRYLTIEQEDSLGGTTYHYPRNKLVMTAPMKLPLFGEIKVREISKEKLMEVWLAILARAKLRIRFSERMEDVAAGEGGFVVKTNKGSHRTANVLFCIGRRGTPRKLGVKGEEQAKVVYRLIEPEQYRGRHVLVVGGGDSAIEAALAVSAEAGTTVTISYRGKAPDRCNPKNRAKLEAATTAKRIRQVAESTVQEIKVDRVTLNAGDGECELRNDVVIVCAGGELPTPMLKKVGIRVEAHYGQ